MYKKVQVASVILNYNSAEDLFLCIEDLRKQKNISQSIIVVDNNSQIECINDIEKKVKKNTVPKLKEIKVENDELQIKEERFQENSNYIIWNKKNGGYSQGNNIGLRLAEKIGAETALIINPDVRIKDEYYLENLHRELLKDKGAVCAGTSIKDMYGNIQSPSRELSFWDEFMWPLEIVSALLGKRKSYIQEIEEEEVVKVEKISGCCMLLKLEEKENNDYLDNNLFLYCEESVLASKIKERGKKIIFVPFLEALHMHKKTPKKKSLGLFIKWCDSRWYYTKNYTSYNLIQKKLLRFSYFTKKNIYRILLKGAS